MLLFCLIEVADVVLFPIGGLINDCWFNLNSLGRFTEVDKDVAIEDVTDTVAGDDFDDWMDAVELIECVVKFLGLLCFIKRFGLVMLS